MLKIRANWTSYWHPYTAMRKANSAEEMKNKPKNSPNYGLITDESVDGVISQDFSLIKQFLQRSR